MQKSPTSRRGFLRTSVAASLAAPLITSLEEYALQAGEPPAAAKPAAAKVTMASGNIGKVKLSRLICGGNLISGYAHSRDLIYVSKLLKAYFTDEKIMETWSVCEQSGVDTMIFNPSDKHALEVYRKYRSRGGKIQMLAQVAPPKEDLKPALQEAVDAGALGVLLVGNFGDAWSREGATGRIGEFVQIVKEQGVIAGVAGHELRTIQAVEQAKVNPDFYMKTLHSTNYWSARKPDQMKEVIDNYGTDNYWCMDPKATIGYMQELEKPWIAYKVLAAGALPPRVGFKYAFDNGADFCVVGMFDFQVAEDVAIANEAIASSQTRERIWA
jgi:hypothetical protein